MQTGAAQQSSTSKRTTSKTSDVIDAEIIEPQQKITFLHVMVEALAGTINEVEKFIKDNKVKAPVVRRAAEELVSRYPDKGELFAQWVKKHYPTGRGKTPPMLGEVREYSAQQVPAKTKKGKKPKMGPVFNRTTLDPLGVKKGDTIVVEFNEATDDRPDHIVIYKKPD